MEVSKETSSTRNLVFGHTVVGMTAVPLCVQSRLQRGVLVRCPGGSDPMGTGNSDPVWIGTANVKADSSAAGGIPVIPGNSMFLPVDDASQLYVISTATNQDVAWMAI